MPEDDVHGTPDAPATVAAVDLGSNSFHMLIGRVVDREITIVDKLKETVRLAAGLDERGALDRTTRQRALECLERFGQRLRDLDSRHVRAVGTNTLRHAVNAPRFLARARKALGHPIEVVSGHEEGRLTYLGVVRSVNDSANRRLVIDIGGGSTECILGSGLEPVLEDSLYMGCVTWSLRYFPSGAVDAGRFRQAEIAAAQEFEPIARAYAEAGWDRCLGSSGSILTIDEILRSQGWSPEGIDAAGLDRLRDALVEAGDARKLSVAGAKDDRLTVLPGGVAILRAAFESLGIRSMTPATGALREGLLYDLVGRIRHEDVRERTVERMAERYGVDAEQARRVESTALEFWRIAAAEWKLDVESDGRLLAWAARLLEIGLAITYTGYHKHSAYLLENSDMPGFSRDEQRILAALVRSHRRKFAPRLFEHLAPPVRKRVRRMCALLRLAVLLRRSRSPRPLPPIRLEVAKKRFRLDFPPGWLEGHPLTEADLEQERARFADAGFSLEVGK